MKHFSLISTIFLFSFFTLIPVSAQVSVVTNTPEQPTEQERFEGSQFVHEGLAQRQAEEACAQLKNPDACRREVKTKFLGLDSNTVKLVSKMSSLVIGLSAVTGGGGFDVLHKGPEKNGLKAGDKTGAVSYTHLTLPTKA